VHSVSQGDDPHTKCVCVCVVVVEFVYNLFICVYVTVRRVCALTSPTDTARLLINVPEDIE